MQTSMPLALLDTIKENNEKFHLIGRPEFWPFILRGVPLLLAGILWCCIDVAFLLKISDLSKGDWMTLLIPFITIHLIPFYLGIINMLRLVLLYRNTYYVFSEERVVIFQGIFKKENQAIPLEQISKLWIQRSPYDRFFHTGSIRLQLAHTEALSEAEPEEDHFELTAIRDFVQTYKKFRRRYHKKIKKHVHTIQKVG